jgi:RimJ/RimL family protein N-acetyltransferase
VVDDAQAAYQRAGQPAYIRIPSFLDGQAERLLAPRGYEVEGHSLTLTASLPVVLSGPGAELMPEPSGEWLEASNAINGRGPGASGAFRAILARLSAPCAFAAVRREGRIVSLAYGAAHGGWLCVEAVATEAAWRGHGLAQQAVAALMAWGAARGALAAGLQVQADNAAAQALYRRLGFARELYRYHYRRGPAG